MDFSLCMFANSLLNWFNSNYKRTFQFSFSFWSHETMPTTKIPTWIFPYRNSIERRLLMMIWYVCFGQMTSQLEWNIQLFQSHSFLNTWNLPKCHRNELLNHANDDGMWLWIHSIAFGFACWWKKPPPLFSNCVSDSVDILSLICRANYLEFCVTDRSCSLHHKSLHTTILK